jgi:hypothetical protein
MLAPISAPLDAPEDDARAVREAAARLRIPEFALFHLAYRRWFGEPASDALLERRFMVFLYGRRVPLWVRHLAREVLASEQTGHELCARFGVQPVLPPRTADGPAERWRRLAPAAFYAACFVLFTYHAL